MTKRIDGELVLFHIKRMDYDEYAWFDAAFKTHARAGVTEDAARAFIVEAFERFLTVGSDLVAPGVDGSERQIKDGKAFLSVYGRYAVLVQELLGSIYTENILDEEKKRALQSLADSPGSSTEPADPGPRPETTAAPVGGEGSAPIEAATPTMLDASSGSTEMSPPVDALFVS